MFDSLYSSSNLFIKGGKKNLSFSDFFALVSLQSSHIASYQFEKGSRVLLVLPDPLDQLSLFFSCLNLGLVPILIHPQTPVSLLKCYSTELDACYIFSKSPRELQRPLKRILSLHPNQHFMLMSSGSSGKANFVSLTLSSMFSSGKAVSDYLSLRSSDTWYNCLPFHHVSGLSIVFRCLYSGSSMLLMSFSLKLFASAAFTHLSLVKSMVYTLSKHLTSPPQSLKVLLCGGSSFTNQEISFLLNQNYPLFMSYGCSEFSSQIACGKIEDSNDICLSFLPHVLFKQNKKDQLLIKGSALFSGYWRQRSHALVQELDDDDYYNTEDRVLIRNSKLLKVYTQENRLISGGENIDLQLIKNTLLKYEGVRKVKVLAIDDLKYGHRPIVYLDVLDQFPKYEDLVSYCKKWLPPYACPNYFLPYSSLD